MKQIVTFDRTITVQMEFEVERPITQQEATFWANFAYNGGSFLDQIVPTKQADQNPHVTTELGKWRPTVAQPDFAPDPTPKRFRRKKA